MKRTKLKALFLMMFSFSVPALVLAQDTSIRLHLQCSEETDGLECTVISKSPFFNDVSIKDRFGVIIDLSGEAQETDEKHVRVEVKSLDSAFALLAKRSASGAVSYHDAEGKELFVNGDFIGYTNPGNSSSDSVVVTGDSKTGNVTIDASAPNLSRDGGSALFIGNTDGKITVNANGKDGAEGLSANQVAARRVLEGEFGQEAAKELAKQFPVDQYVKPSTNLDFLAAAPQSCQDVSTGDGLPLLTASLSNDGRKNLGFGYYREDKLVERRVCERRVEEEFEVVNSCVRPQEKRSTLTCGYPDLVAYKPVYRRPIETIKTQYSCTPELPVGHWELTCQAKDKAVLASAIKPTFLNLKPSNDISAGATPAFASELPFLQTLQRFQRKTIHSFESDSLTMADSTWSKLFYGTSAFTQQNKNNMSTLFAEGGTFKDSLGSSSQSVQQGLNGFFSPYGEMADNSARLSIDSYLARHLRRNGFLTWAYTKAYAPGSDAEGLDASKPELTKLTYWSDKIDNNKYTDLTNKKALPTRGALLADMIPFWQEVDELGYSVPWENPAQKTAIKTEDLTKNLVIGFSQIDVRKDVPANGSGSHKPVPAQGSSPAIEEEKAFTVENIIDYIESNYKIASSPNETGFVPALLSTSETEIKNYYKNSFSERLTYTFQNLKTGLALSIKNSLDGNRSDSVTRTSVDGNFLSAIVFIPGTNHFGRVKNTKVCKEIKFDHWAPIQTPDTFPSGEATGPYKSPDYTGPWLPPEVYYTADQNIKYGFILPDPLHMASPFRFFRSETTWNYESDRISSDGKNQSRNPEGKNGCDNGDMPCYGHPGRFPGGQGGPLWSRRMGGQMVGAVRIEGNSNNHYNSGLIAPQSNAPMRLVDTLVSGKVVCEESPAFEDKANGEDEIFKQLRNAGGAIIIAGQNTSGKNQITIFHNPFFRSTKDKKFLAVNTSLEPGMYDATYNINEAQATVDGVGAVASRTLSSNSMETHPSPGDTVKSNGNTKLEAGAPVATGEYTQDTAFESGAAESEGNKKYLKRVKNLTFNRNKTKYDHVESGYSPLSRDQRRAFVIGSSLGINVDSKNCNSVQTIRYPISLLSRSYQPTLQNTDVGDSPASGLFSNIDITEQNPLSLDNQRYFFSDPYIPFIAQRQINMFNSNEGVLGGVLAAETRGLSPRYYGSSSFKDFREEPRNLAQSYNNFLLQQMHNAGLNHIDGTFKDYSLSLQSGGDTSGSTYSKSQEKSNTLGSSYAHFLERPNERTPGYNQNTGLFGALKAGVRRYDYSTRYLSSSFTRYRANNALSEAFCDDFLNGLCEWMLFLSVIGQHPESHSAQITMSWPYKDPSDQAVKEKAYDYIYGEVLGGGGSPVSFENHLGHGPDLLHLKNAEQKGFFAPHLYSNLDLYDGNAMQGLANLSSATIGGKNENGGALFNQTSFVLPPVGVISPMEMSVLSFQASEKKFRHGEVDGEECGSLDISGCDFFDRTGQWVSGETIYNQLTAYVFHGPAARDSNFWNYPLTPGDPAHGSHTAKTQASALYNLGLSGYLYSECTPEFTYAGSSQELQVLGGVFEDTFLNATVYAPIGIGLTALGRPYFGPWRPQVFNEADAGLNPVPQEHRKAYYPLRPETRNFLEPIHIENGTVDVQKSTKLRLSPYNNSSLSRVDQLGRPGFNEADRLSRPEASDPSFHGPEKEILGASTGTISGFHGTVDAALRSTAHRVTYGGDGNDEKGYAYEELAVVSPTALAAIFLHTSGSMSNHDRRLVREIFRERTGALQDSCNTSELPSFQDSGFSSCSSPTVFHEIQELDGGTSSSLHFSNALSSLQYCNINEAAGLAPNPDPSQQGLVCPFFKNLTYSAPLAVGSPKESQYFAWKIYQDSIVAETLGLANSPVAGQVSIPYSGSIWGGDTSVARYIPLTSNGSPAMNNGQFVVLSSTRSQGLLPEISKTALEQLQAVPFFIETTEESAASPYKILSVPHNGQTILAAGGVVAQAGSFGLSQLIPSASNRPYFFLENLCNSSNRRKLIEKWGRDTAINAQAENQFSLQLKYDPLFTYCEASSESPSVYYLGSSLFNDNLESHVRVFSDKAEELADLAGSERGSYYVKKQFWKAIFQSNDVFLKFDGLSSYQGSAIPLRENASSRPQCSDASPSLGNYSLAAARFKIGAEDQVYTWNRIPADSGIDSCVATGSCAVWELQGRAASDVSFDYELSSPPAGTYDLWKTGASEYKKIPRGCGQAANEVGSRFAVLFDDEAKCYHPQTGDSAQDSRSTAERSSPICLDNNSDTGFRSTLLETYGNNKVLLPYVAGTPQGEKLAISGNGLTPPSGPEKESYTILKGILEDHRLLYVGNRSPGKEGPLYLRDLEEGDKNYLQYATGWVPSRDATSDGLTCGVIRVDSDSSPTNLNRGKLWTDGAPPAQFLSLTPSLFEVQEETRFGERDPYSAQTDPKRIYLPDATISGVDRNELGFTCGGSNMNESTFGIRPGFSACNPADPDDECPSIGDLSQVLSVKLERPREVTILRQYTPWGTEWRDSLGLGDFFQAPECSIYDNLDPTTGVGKQNIIEAAEPSSGTSLPFYLDGKIFEFNALGARDSSASTTPRLYTGGRWTEIGKEIIPVPSSGIKTYTCEIDPKTGSFSCNYPTKISTRFIDGENISIQGSPGGDGTHGGKITVLTSRPWNLSESSFSARGGSGGSSGSTSLVGRSGDGRELMCFATSSDSNNPWITFIKYTSGSVQVREAQPGRSGNEGIIFKGWGVSQEALDFLEKEILNK
jgi:hypothetical protein